MLPPALEQESDRLDEKISSTSAVSTTQDLSISIKGVQLQSTVPYSPSKQENKSEDERILATRNNQTAATVSRGSSHSLLYRVNDLNCISIHNDQQIELTGNHHTDDDNGESRGVEELQYAHEVNDSGRKAQNQNDASNNQAIVKSTSVESINEKQGFSFFKLR